ncbi:UNVERIFIED_CONTAM: hypothetical protein FKN15_073493 [Acipenser sinensis]
MEEKQERVKHEFAQILTPPESPGSLDEEAEIPRQDSPVSNGDHTPSMSRSTKPDSQQSGSTPPSTRARSSSANSEQLGDVPAREDGSIDKRRLTYYQRKLRQIEKQNKKLQQQVEKYKKSMSIEDLEKAPCDKDGILNNHCHDKNRASEDRKIEQKLAKQRLWIVSAVCMVFMVGEIVGGYIAGSLAVMTDAAHLLVDFASFMISLCSLWLSSRPATKRLNYGWHRAGGYIAGSLAVMTDAAHLLVDFASFMISLCSLWLSSRPATKRLNYGWHRAEILGALLSIFTIWLVTGVLVYLACERLISNNYTIDGTVMLITSGCAVLANIIMGLTLHQTGHGHSHIGGSSHGHGHSHGKRSMEESGHLPQDNASVRAAFIHVLGDLLQSFSVLISAIIIFFKPEYKIADPICTFLFSLFVLVTTFTILRDILLVLMEGAPIGIKYNAVRDRILMVKGVKAIHNMYIWALTMNQVVLSAHVVLDDTVNPQPALKEVTEACFDNFSFHSVTIQVEQQLDQNPDCAYCQDPKD